MLLPYCPSVLITYDADCWNDIQDQSFGYGEVSEVEFNNTAFQQVH